MIFLLFSCTKGTPEDHQKPPTLADYAGTAGNLLMFSPLEEPDGPTEMLLISEESWEIRVGDFWEEAEPGDHWSWSLEEEGLQVGSDLLLPAGLKKGSSSGSATIEAVGAFTTWYGDFSDTLLVTVEDGAWAGQLVFARGLGPIRFSRGGDWDLVYYQYDWSPRNAGDTGDTGG